MSKRFAYNQQHGDRKKAKLDISISDHNFPLSQNSSDIKEGDHDNWGDDNDDEILLLASQACEDAYSNDVSMLPNYSMCMQPSSTSTQFDPSPSTSKAPFTFKKPTANLPSAISTNLKNKCSTISSPLPGMSTKALTKSNEQVNLCDDLVFNDKICKEQDPDYIYRQLLQLQEDNAKLKSENGKLLEKCVTKEGEASILRTQLKTCQVAVDNARMEKIKAQEKVQMEWTEKLASANSQMHDLRTQLDFKNLEIISVKEKCKKLESTKLKLTQVTVANNDISSSHRINSSYAPNDISQAKRVKTVSNAVQTDDKIYFLKLARPLRKESSQLTRILPLILESTPQQHSILDYNEKLQKHTDFAQSKCRVFSTFHRIPATPMQIKEINKNKVSLNSIYKDLTCITAGTEDVDSLNNSYFNLFSAFASVLLEVQCDLEAISQRVTNAFQREMDEKYIEASSTFLLVDKEDLLKGRALYKDEQAILARRLTATISFVIDKCKTTQHFTNFEEKQSEGSVPVFDIIKRICNLLDSTSCATLYSGFLLSLTILMETFHKFANKYQPKVIEYIKAVVLARPMPFVCCQLLVLMRKICFIDNFLASFCPRSSSGNLKVDYDQGVLLYKKDSCYLQVLLKQVESALKCVERQACPRPASVVLRHLVAVYVNTSSAYDADQDKAKCNCQQILLQVMVYALRICAVALNNLKPDEEEVTRLELLSACLPAVQAWYRHAAAEVEPPLACYEGYLTQACLHLPRHTHHIYSHMLTELTSTFQASPEETTTSFHRQPWLKSFESFSITD